jgi:diguanylate cyclase (GGDEF)-like protein
MSEKPEVVTAALLTAADLEALDLFRGEEPEYLDWVLHSCRVRSLLPGEILLEPGNNNDALYIILSGRAEVRFTHDDLCSSIYLESGDCAGEMSVIEDSRPSATVIAISHCQVIVIDADVLWLLIERSSIVARNLLQHLSTRMRRNNLELVQSHIQRCIHEYEALHDPLTRLKNRRWMEGKFVGIVESCKRDGEPLALLMIDTDHFKRYNDEYGHLAGDQLLVAIAGIINQNIRSGDHACRYGGDEFVVVLPRIDSSKAIKFAERICSSVREKIPRTVDAQLVARVSVSIGVASLEPRMHVRQLLASADAALYRAKAAGRDRASH